jgi:tetraacyldisaccharide 4'-kinase
MEIKGIRRKIYAVAAGDERAAGTLGLFFLSFISKIYGLIIKLRSALYDRHLFRVKKLPCAVISIGNLSVGGTGKTPMAIHVAELISRLGYRVCVISRGYKGSAEQKGGIVSDGRHLLMDAWAAGDEPFMMAQRLNGIPVLVGADRFRAGLRAVCAFSSNVVVLDDGFQHRRLGRDIELVMIDDRFFLGDQHLLPRGMLREPVSALKRGDAFVLTRSVYEPSRNLELLQSLFPEKPVFKACHVPYLQGVFRAGKAIDQEAEGRAPDERMGFLKDARVFVFSGIAGNQGFVQMVEKMVKGVAGIAAFPDHHRYSEKDLAEILDRAEKSEADFMVTTHKDYVRIAPRFKGGIDTVVIGVRIALADQAPVFAEFVRERVASALGRGL